MSECKMSELSVVVVGDSYCGKTQLLNRISKNIFSQKYRRTGFNKIEIPEISVNITVWDTSGSASYESLRPLVYRDCSVVLVCYSVAGLDEVKYWAKEVRQSTTAPIVLVHTKNDVDKDKDIKIISETVGAVDNISTSAKTGENVEKVLKLCVSAAAIVKIDKQVNNGREKSRRPNSLNISSLTPQDVCRRNSSSISHLYAPPVPRRCYSSLSAQVRPNMLYRRSNARLSIHSKLKHVPTPLSPNQYSDTSSILSPTETSVSSDISIPSFHNYKCLFLPSPSTSGSSYSSLSISPSSFQSSRNSCRENIQSEKKVKSDDEKIAELEENCDVLLSGGPIVISEPKSKKTAKSSNYNAALLKGGLKNRSKKERCSLM